MLSLISEEDYNYLVQVIQELRNEVHTCNLDLDLIDQSLNDQLDPPTSSVYLANSIAKQQLIAKRQASVNMIMDIREVLVNPPSFESRVIGFVAPFLSFSYI